MERSMGGALLACAILILLCWWIHGNPDVDEHTMQAIFGKKE